jgi:hypothetical protein
MQVSDVLVSLAGVLLIVGLVWWAMGSAVARIDEAHARERLTFEYPDFTIGRLLLGTDGRGALAFSKDGSELVVLFALGSRITCWRLPKTSVQAKLQSNPPALLLDTHDFTLPRLRLPIGDSPSNRELAASLAGGVP